MTSRPGSLVRFTLAGGVRVVRRGRAHLQVGLVPGRSLVVPDTEAHRDVLDALRTADLPPQPEADALIPRLAAHGLLRVAGPGPTPPVDVVVDGDLGVAPAPLLETAGLHAVPAPRAAAARRRRPTRVSAPQPPPVLLLAAAELDRCRLDALVRDGVPHLVVRVIDGGPVLGPLVVPGETACTRCIDAHRGDDDPSHLAVLERYLVAAPPPGGDPPLPATLATLLTCWAAHELRSYVDGTRPTSWSSTLAWDPTFTELTAASWSRHPACGCSWDGIVDRSGTIGA